MPEELLKFSKIGFLIHVILGALFAILYWLPGVSAPLFGFTYAPVTDGLSQVFAAAITGLTIGSVFAAMAKQWNEVKILVYIELIWLGLGIIATLINVLAFGTTTVLFVIVLGVLFALFLLIFLKQEGKMK